MAACSTLRSFGAIQGEPPRRGLEARLRKEAVRMSTSDALLTETVQAGTDPAYVIAQAQFHAIAEKLDLDEGTRTLLSSPKRELSTNFPVKMDEGDLRVFKGYRV